MANSWNVDLVQSTHGRTAWAACVAMLLNHRDSTSLTDADVDGESGVDDLLDRYLLFPQQYVAPTPGEWDGLLGPGPVIAAVLDRVVVVGAVGAVEDDQECEIYVLDPVYGESWVPYRELGDRYGFHPGSELRIVQL